MVMMLFRTCLTKKKRIMEAIEFLYVNTAASRCGAEAHSHVVIDAAKHAGCTRASPVASNQTHEALDSIMLK